MAGERGVVNGAGSSSSVCQHDLLPSSLKSLLASTSFCLDSSGLPRHPAKENIGDSMPKVPAHFSLMGGGRIGLGVFLWQKLLSLWISYQKTMTCERFKVCRSG